MVYCGKASQGCESCRVRRIKCDKVRPQCTQCIRVRKQCPGYRDQLSLMFRDESTKVIQKAHAQWGVSDTYDFGDSSGSSPTSASTPPPRGQPPVSKSPMPRPAPTATNVQGASLGERLAKEICAPPVDKAVQFYIEHCVIGLPDEPRAGQELRGMRWIHSRETQNIMAAVGFAALSNLTGDKGMNTLAKQHYGLVLRDMASAVRNIRDLDLELVLRAVVMMAMYEVTRGRDEPISPARTHVMGAAAILSNFIHRPLAPTDSTRGLLQLCFSMVASKQSAFQYASPEPNVVIPTRIEPSCEVALPKMFFDWLSMIDQTVSEPDRPSADLLKIIVRFVRLSSLVRTQPLVDGHPKTADGIREALEIDQLLESWSNQQQQQQQTGSTWFVIEEHLDPGSFPSEAVFEGAYHVYDNTYVARVWNHYRWARTLANQLLLESVDRFPASGAPLVPPERQRRCLECVARLARDTLVSVPTHYRHPALRPEHVDCFDKTKPGSGVGIVGVPTLLFEVKVAGAAPGIPQRYRAWALGILETAYRDIGMFQASALAGFLRRMVEREGEGGLSPLNGGRG